MTTEPDREGPPACAGEALEAVLQPDDAGCRLDKVLSDRMGDRPGLSRTRLQHLIAAGHVSLDGVPALVGSLKVPAAGHLVVRVPAAAEAEPRPQAIPFPVVFEDEHLLVLDKPAGLVVHPGAGHEDGTLVNALLAHCGASLSGIGGVRRPGIVHRLDKDTSGLMVVAKTDAAHAGLSALFADHGRSVHLDRRYLAFVWGTPATPAGIVDKPLGRHPIHRDRMSVVSALARGREAITHWRFLQPLGSASLVECRLETGRTHQIRVHLTAIGHPLLGDPVYGTGFRTKAARLPPEGLAALAALGRQALHAAILGFDHPVTGRRLGFESPLPADLLALRDALG